MATSRGIWLIKQTETVINNAVTKHAEPAETNDVKGMQSLDLTKIIIIHTVKCLLRIKDNFLNMFMCFSYVKNCNSTQ